MAKDDILSLRVDKEFKKHLQREAKRKGVSLAKYIELHFEDNFRDTKSLVHMLIENAKDERPEYWKQLEGNPILRKLEFFGEAYLTDFLHPMGSGDYEPTRHGLFMLERIMYLIGDTANLFETIDEKYRQDAAENYFGMVEAVAKNLNKFKSAEPDTQKYIISAIKELIELLSFNFTSSAFAKESFVKIKEELDKTEKILLREIEEKAKR